MIDQYLRLFLFQDKTCDIIQELSELRQKPQRMQLKSGCTFNSKGMLLHSCMAQKYITLIQLQWKLEDSPSSLVGSAQQFKNREITLMEVQCKSAKASVRELGKIKLSSSKIDSYQLNDILEKYSINTIINKHFTV